MNELPPIEIDPNSFLRKHCTLPALPQVLMRIQEIVQNQEVTVGEVSRVIGTDPSMVAQVLKVVNSSYYSLPREIIDIKMGVAYLGISEIYRIVLSMSVINTLATTKKEIFRDIWFHSAHTALCARAVAKEFEPLLSGNELWVSALLHDVGKLVYLKFFPDHFDAMSDYCAAKGCLFSEAEKHFKLPPSAYLGSLLCDHWRLPAKIKAACARHTMYDLPSLIGRSETETFLRVIAVGNLLAVLASVALADEKRTQITRILQKVLKLDDQAFLLLLASASELKMEAEQLV